MQNKALETFLLWSHEFESSGRKVEKALKVTNIQMYKREINIEKAGKLGLCRLLLNNLKVIKFYITFFKVFTWCILPKATIITVTKVGQRHTKQ